MDDHVVTALWRAFDARDWARALGLLSDDFVADWPQTCERVRGADAFIALNANFPGRWRCHLRELIEAGERAVSWVLLTDGNDIVHTVSLYRLRDGQITEAVEVFADSGEPPYDRSRWTERYELKLPTG
ncbi:nuclear transport factor 2 family protein [Mycobacterium sp. KBS0706]|jgi:ketosteroid isomerase-like protein|uniref:nuclear transport factor 2 family protein n=1 Tax=Mycobacterium sp. KBS0706 TaxID=2578109 RepID=UPI00110F8386|nr:nuclear transport factor 2 family protein [Mycobacterium sp. KBS0706]TSD84830.1 nuclear transport factor 2 family protein [Mycobacterium sp. KBS0706]